MSRRRRNSAARFDFHLSRSPERHFAHQPAKPGDNRCFFEPPHKQAISRRGLSLDFWLYSARATELKQPRPLGQPPPSCCHSFSPCSLCTSQSTWLTRSAHLQLIPWYVHPYPEFMSGQTRGLGYHGIASANSCPIQHLVMAHVPETTNIDISKGTRAAEKEARGPPAEARDEQHQLTRRVREMGETPTTTRQGYGGIREHEYAPGGPGYRADFPLTRYFYRQGGLSPENLIRMER